MPVWKSRLDGTSSTSHTKVTTMRRIAVTCLLLALPSLLNAQEPAVRLSTCISDNTSGRDRKDLARWVFFAMASIPEFNPYLAPTATEALEEANRSTGALFTRLLTDSCAAQTKRSSQAGWATSSGRRIRHFGSTRNTGADDKRLRQRNRSRSSEVHRSTEVE